MNPPPSCQQALGGQQAIDTKVIHHLSNLRVSDQYRDINFEVYVVVWVASGIVGFPGASSETYAPVWTWHIVG